MNKYLLLAAAVTATLASCSQDDTTDMNPGTGISFRASLDKSLARMLHGPSADCCSTDDAVRPTGPAMCSADAPFQRSNVIHLRNLNHFKVTALAERSSYFTDLDVTSDDDGQTWHTSSTHYWPHFGLGFFAYAPASLSSSITLSSTEQLLRNFTPAASVADQHDLLVSHQTGVRQINEHTGVCLHFKHALAQVEIQAKCSNPNIRIEVKGVKVANVATTADFLFPTEPTETGAPLSDALWVRHSGQNQPDRAYYAAGSQSVTLTHEAQSLMFGANRFMLLPQALTPWMGSTESQGAYLSVLCRISNVDPHTQTETLLFPQPVPGDDKAGKFAYAAVGISSKWLPGKKYIYTLDFCQVGGGAGQLDPSPGMPVIPGVTVDPNPLPNGNGGDLILGKPIQFTVNVDDWSDTTVESPM